MEEAFAGPEARLEAGGKDSQKWVGGDL